MTPLTWRRGRIAATALNTLMVFVNTGRYSPSAWIENLT